jgi:hypothetical protein
MVSRDDTNTRLKDFYDIWIIIKNIDFNFDNVCLAIIETFKYYQTEIPKSTPICFLKDFYENNKIKTHWNIFLKRSRIERSLELSIIIERITNFMIPVCNFINKSEKKYNYWNDKQGWY